MRRLTEEQREKIRSAISTEYEYTVLTPHMMYTLLDSLDAAEVEVTALKARRCGTCRWWGPPKGFLCYHCSCGHLKHDSLKTFGCTHWEARDDS